MEAFTLTLIEERIWVATHPTGMQRYDFAFEEFFACRHPMKLDGPVLAVARMGAPEDYAARYQELLDANVRLIHSPEEYDRASLLPKWYPIISDLTPHSVCYPQPPAAEEIEGTFGWPVFIKGARQTSRHQRKLSIIENREQYGQLLGIWRHDPILSWQPMVCREFIPLRPVGQQSRHTMPRSFEFRSFWWKGQCAGIGPYWIDEHYELSRGERSDALALAEECARRMDLVFVVIDIAQTASGQWIVIECNDGQDSGYAGVNPMLLWRKILDIDRDQPNADAGFPSADR